MRGLHAGHECVVHAAPGLFGHPERAVAQTGGHVFGGAAEPRDLVVVDGGRAVHREVRDDAASHQFDEQRRQPGLHDVAAEHGHHAPVATLGVGDGLHDALEVARDEHIGEGVEERAERAVVARRVRELRSIHLVGAARHRHGVHGVQIGLVVLHGVAGPRARRVRAMRNRFNASFHGRTRLSRGRRS